MRHREVDGADAVVLRPGRDPAGEVHRRLRSAYDLDVLPGERARDAEAECLADGFLARDPARIALGRVRTRLAVRLLGLREAPVAEAGVTLERTADARDLDEIGADADQRCSSSHS